MVSSTTAALVLSAAASMGADVFRLPTGNDALFEEDGGERFYVGTVGRTWESGMFGCVRSEGGQMHEGIDIRALERDRRGEPIDRVMATADGVVVYINAKPGLSNYGNYIIIRHRIEGLEVHSLYAHLRSIEPELKAGQSVRSGDVIGVLGRTANTRQGISRERAHLHLELLLMRTDRFEKWLKQTHPGQRNDHGQWNGRNFVGLDPARIFLEQRAQGSDFSLVRFIRTQEALCRVFIRQPDFSWPIRYPPLVWPNPRAEMEGVAGYEVALNYNGLPIEIIPRAASEIPGTARFQLLSVNQEERARNPCRRLVEVRGNRWELTTGAINALELLAY